MNIMHLLSQNHLTGAEVYAVQLCEQQIKAGHHVLQVSNGFFTPTSAHQIQFPVEAQGRLQFIKNIFLLRKLIIEKKVQIIHCHSRASAKLAFWARLLLPVGLISTVHGRQHPSISKKIWNTYGDFLIPVCENIERQLVEDFNYQPSQVACLRNPISAELFHFSEKSQDIEFHIDSKKIKIAVIGRTTGPKGQRTEYILNALPHLLRSLQISAEYFLVGGNKSDLNLTTSVPLQELKVDRLTTADYEPYDLVIGSGRVALEALVSGVPVIAFGEAVFEGLVTDSNLAQCYRSNFGDIHDSAAPQLDLQKLETDLRQFFQKTLSFSQRKSISERIGSDFKPQVISQKIQRFYESSYFQRNYRKWIPILMYHKIPLTALQSQHQIFVTQDNFRKHLEFYRARGFTTVTFNQLNEFKSGRKDFKFFPKKPLILTFDDGYQDNLDHASPLLKEFGFKAQLFLLADSTVNSNYWDHSETEIPHGIVAGDDRQKWKNSAFEIGSHGLSHRKITQMNEADAREELRSSKIILEKEFGVPVSVYAFTYGDTNEDCAEWAQEEGYDYAVNTDTGGLLLEKGPYQIFRVNIFPNETKLSLFKKTSSWYRNYYFRKRKK